MEQSLIDNIADAIDDKLEKVDWVIATLPPIQQIFSYVYRAQVVIENGGFRYFFEEDMPGTPLYSRVSDAYRAIGAVTVADCFDQAVAMFPFAEPETNLQGRLPFLNDADDDALYSDLDQAAYGEKVWELLSSFVLAHPDAFQFVNH